MRSKTSLKVPKVPKVRSNRTNLPKMTTTKVSTTPKVSYVLRKDHAKPTKIA
jgi:hypothetical protein